MDSQIKRGRGQLRDTSAACGTYEVDYEVREDVRFLKHLGAPTTTRRTITASIRLVSGYVLKNGRYALEDAGLKLCELEKSGTDWRVLP